MMAILKKVRMNTPKEIGGSLFVEQEINMIEMKRRTPVKKGILKSSGHVLPPEFLGNNTILVRTVFGGGAEEYAERVHEDLEAFHETGQAKFMESVQRETSGSMLARVGKRIDLRKTF